MKFGAYRMETTIPFSGFYNSHHDSNLDYELESMFSDENGNSYQSIVEKASDLADWQAIHTDYAKKYTEALATKFDIRSLKFSKLSSPKFYNFETDRIFCTITQKEVKRIFKLVNKELLENEIKDRFTSRSGFISYYPNTIKEWPKALKDWDINHVGTLIEAYIKQANNGDFESSEQAEIFDGSSEVCNSILDENIKNIGRLYNLADYLRTRKTRKDNQELGIPSN